MDGIDAAIVKTDGDRIQKFGPTASYAYGGDFRNRLRATIDGAGNVPSVEAELTEQHVTAVRSLLSDNGLAAGDIDLIGFHGHTVLHDAAAGRTWQIGDGRRLARETGIDVIDQFRLADVAAGGEGAPLAPLYHAACAQDLERPLAILNIGGVANVTWLGGGGIDADSPDILAFDTGPGNALIDDWIQRVTDAAMDVDGALAATGKVDTPALAALLDHLYFQRPPPKSLDRNDFDLGPVGDLSPEDGAATLTAFTAAAVSQGTCYLAAAPRRWLVCGGGRKNLSILEALRQRLDAAVEPVESVGWDGDALEAQAFAFLAVRSKLELPLSLPQTTGVSRPLTGGQLHESGANFD